MGKKNKKDTKSKKDKVIKFNNGKLMWSLVDFPSLVPLVLALMHGSRKYKDSPENLNYKKQFDKYTLLDSLLRHTLELASGKEFDPESGLPIIGHIMANCLFYSYHFTPEEFKNMYQIYGTQKRTTKRQKGRNS